MEPTNIAPSISKSLRVHTCSRKPLLARSYRKAVILALHLLGISQNFLRGYTAPQHQFDGHHGDPQIKPQRCIADIPLVQLFFFLFGYELGAIDLGPSADTRANRKSYRRVRGLILREQGSRPDQGHFAKQHIQQLRQFIKTRRPQESANCGRSSAARRRMPSRVKRRFQGSKFVDQERPALAAKPFLPEENGWAYI